MSKYSKLIKKYSDIVDKQRILVNDVYAIRPEIIANDTAVELHIRMYLLAKTFADNNRSIRSVRNLNSSIRITYDFVEKRRLSIEKHNKKYDEVLELNKHRKDVEAELFMTFQKEYEKYDIRIEPAEVNFLINQFSYSRSYGGREESWTEILKKKFPLWNTEGYFSEKTKIGPFETYPDKNVIVSQRDPGTISDNMLDSAYDDRRKEIIRKWCSLPKTKPKSQKEIAKKPKERNAENKVENML